jgi:hypothetical protein
MPKPQWPDDEFHMLPPSSLIKIGSEVELSCRLSPTTPRGRLKNKDKTKSNNTAITRRASNTPQSAHWLLIQFRFCNLTVATSPSIIIPVHPSSIIFDDGGWMDWDDDGWTGGHSQITEAELYQQSMWRIKTLSICGVLEALLVMAVLLLFVLSLFLRRPRGVAGLEYDGGWMDWDDDGWTGGHSQITEAELYQQSMWRIIAILSWFFPNFIPKSNY